MNCIPNQVSGGGTCRLRSFLSSFPRFTNCRGRCPQRPVGQRADTRFPYEIKPFSQLDIFFVEIFISLCYNIKGKQMANGAKALHEHETKRI